MRPLAWMVWYVKGTKQPLSQSVGEGRLRPAAEKPRNFAFLAPPSHPQHQDPQNHNEVRKLRQLVEGLT